MRPKSAAEARDALGIPVIDADAHTVELVPMLGDHLRAEGLDPPLAECETLGDYVSALFGGGPSWERADTATRLHSRLARAPWWGFPWSNTLDMATASLPHLLYERLDELGIDVAVVYPSLGLVFASVADDEKRRAACRAVNRYHREVFSGLGDRLLPVAVVPTHTPDEAIEELDEALSLGFRAVVIPSYVRRPIPAGPGMTWVDSYGLDSAYDYDPFWARCVESGIAVGTHSGTMGWDARRSVSNYMYNHIGHLGAAGEVCCKSLFFGGVTHRFPDLHVAFLEGGVAWACSLYADLVGHWSKRNPQNLSRYDPDRLDRERFAELVDKYGGFSHEYPRGVTGPGWAIERFDRPPDEWLACGITRVEDIADRFVPNFFFGCEADDPFVRLAFDAANNPSGAELRTLFGSDVGHWDVPFMNRVLEEVWEQVDEGRLTVEQVSRFCHRNAREFYEGPNPRFFAGTVVDQHTSRRSV